MRSIPHGSRLCHEREIERLQNIHKDKLRTMRPTHHNPPPLPLLIPNLKKLNSHKKAEAEISTRNRHLMTKIMTIMQPSSPPASGVSFLPGVRISKNMVPSTDCYVNANHETNKSLNFTKSERDYSRVVSENNVISKRLRENKGVLSRQEWERHKNESIKYALNARARDLCCGHLSSSRRGGSRNSNTRGGSRKGSIVKQEEKMRSYKNQQVDELVIAEADIVVERNECRLIVSELSSSFTTTTTTTTDNDEEEALTTKIQGSVGISIKAKSKDGLLKSGETIITCSNLQRMIISSSQSETNDSLLTFSNLELLEGQPVEGRLYPSFERCLSAQEEVKLAKYVIANTFVSLEVNGRGGKIKVSVGKLR